MWLSYCHLQEKVGGYTVERARLFLDVQSERMRGNRHICSNRNFDHVLGKKNSLSGWSDIKQGCRGTEESSFLEIIRASLEKTLGNLIQCLPSFAQEGGPKNCLKFFPNHIFNDAV